MRKLIGLSCMALLIVGCVAAVNANPKPPGAFCGTAEHNGVYEICHWDSNGNGVWRRTTQARAEAAHAIPDHLLDHGGAGYREETILVHGCIDGGSHRCDNDQSGGNAGSFRAYKNSQGTPTPREQTITIPRNETPTPTPRPTPTPTAAYVDRGSSGTYTIIEYEVSADGSTVTERRRERTHSDDCRQYGTIHGHAGGGLTAQCADEEYRVSAEEREFHASVGDYHTRNRNMRVHDHTTPSDHGGVPHTHPEQTCVYTTARIVATPSPIEHIGSNNCYGND